MPSHHCKHPTCAAILPKRGYCTEHQPQQQAQDKAKAMAAQHSDRKRRERTPELVALYGSGAWKRTSKHVRAEQPLCGVCGTAWATSVHHRTKAKDDKSKWYARDNLIGVCRACHERLDAEGK
jgi:5-methylcytosine-specific restriction endonuclease McrA